MARHHVAQFCPPVEEISTRSNFEFFFLIIDISSRPYGTRTYAFLPIHNLNLTSKSTLVLK
ncbi:hypothetical protein EKN94_06825 [Enterobacter quasimori]|uniref:Uncharacterized protein n=1 Tax=Enterobacter quasimori TaxID=2838947 RepID=A0ABY0AWH4_9ENTR|nr:hypothetical protein EKN94_06825 [Enterobacter quasimori]